MRFRLPGAILFALALFTQVLMPVSMARASALASDPLAHSIICGQTADSDGGSQDLPLTAAGHEHCPLCLSAGGGTALLDAPSNYLTIPHAVVRSIEWNALPARVTSVSLGQHAPPRGPPTLA